jgi:hypothetical protein
VKAGGDGVPQRIGCWLEFLEIVHGEGGEGHWV